MKKTLKIFAVILVTCTLLAAAGVGYLSIREYRPEPVEILQAPSQNQVLDAKDSLHILTYNIGYAGLDKDMDFFMDGGTKVNPESKEKVETNLQGIQKILKDQSADIYLLQEVDTNSDRSFHINEKEYLEDNLNQSGVLAYNFKCDYVPYPFPPIGKVESGILTMTNYSISQASRISLPESFSWPTKICNLKRCMLETRIPIKDTDKELVIINFHLEAYDSGEGKIAQSKKLAKKLQEEYEKGNYVIAGGDFNQTFEGMDTYPITNKENWVLGIMRQEDLPEHFTFSNADNAPTCRLLNEAYQKDSQVYVIDGFITSDNLEVTSIQNIDTQFEYTDHQPVSIQVKFK